MYIMFSKLAADIIANSPRGCASLASAVGHMNNGNAHSFYNNEVLTDTSFTFTSTRGLNQIFWNPISFSLRVISSEEPVII